MKTKRWLKVLTSVLFLLVVFSGCTPIYIPNTIDIPTYEKAGEISISGFTGSSGIDLQAGVAVTDNIAFTANGSFASRNSTGENNYHKHNLGELSINVFGPISENGWGTITMGVGTGNVTSSSSSFWGNEIITAEGKFTRAYWQASLGVKTGFLNAGFAYRLSYVQFNQMTYNENHITAPLWRKWEYFHEPGIYFELGARNVKFLLQGGLSNPVHNENNFDHEPAWVAFGIKINITAFSEK